AASITTTSPGAWSKPKAAIARPWPRRRRRRRRRRPIERASAAGTAAEGLLYLAAAERAADAVRQGGAGLAEAVGHHAVAGADGQGAAGGVGAAAVRRGLQQQGGRRGDLGLAAAAPAAAVRIGSGQGLAAIAAVAGAVGQHVEGGAIHADGHGAAVAGAACALRGLLDAALQTGADLGLRARGMHLDGAELALRHLQSGAAAAERAANQ